ncbi:CU044_2847 family protein [Microbispora rosea]
MEATVPPGTQPTSRSERRTELLHDMFLRAQAVVEQIAFSAIEIRHKLASKANPPNQVEVQFGVKFSTQGQIIVASASTEASLAIKLIFNGNITEDDEDNSPVNNSIEGRDSDG